MIIEILVVLLIIIMVIIFLLFFKPLHLHILIENHNLKYNFEIKINFLLIQLDVEKNNSSTNIIINLNIISRLIKLYDFDFKSNKNEDKISEQNSKDEIKSEQNSKDEKKLFTNIKESYPLLIKSKEELYEIILLVISLIKFKNAYLNMKLGLEDNNLTIKICNVLWSLTAPLYPLNFYFTLTPEINKLLLKSEGDIALDVKLFNILKIVIIIIKSGNLRTLIKKLVVDSE